MLTSDFKLALQHRLVEYQRANGPVSTGELPAVLARLTDILAAEEPIPADQVSDTHLRIEAEFEIFGPLEPLMHDATISEIMVNGIREVFIERGGVKMPSNVHFRDSAQLNHTIDRLLSFESGARVDAARPMANLSAPDGSRVNIVIPPISFGWPKITIRKYLGQFRDVASLLAVGTLDDRMATFLTGCVQGRINLLFSGSTATGKTTLVEVLSHAIDPAERVVVIEDTLELRFNQPNVVRLLTRLANLEGKGEVTIGDLFRNSLRMAPDRIILGEIRGREAFDYLQALNSGHRGSMAVIHASSPEEALIRLENLVPLAGLGVPPQVTRRQIAHGVQAVVQVSQLADGSRKITRIAEVLGQDDDGTLLVRDLFRFEEESSANGHVHGRFAATGAVPRFQAALERAGIDVSRRLYAPAETGRASATA